MFCNFDFFFVCLGWGEGRYKWGWVILMGTVRVLGSLRSHGGAREILSAFWIWLRRADF